MTRKQFPGLLEQKNKGSINQTKTRKLVTRKNNRETTRKRAPQPAGRMRVKNQSAKRKNS
jgi:hypothetical protein